jgi:hypothetical protein
MSIRRRFLVVCSLLLLVAFAFRLAVARYLPNDDPDDGRIYAQMARNLLEQHVYSHATEAPYAPSLIRLPGYPLFIAAVYAVFGHTNNTAVRITQAVLDTATCVLIALIAFQWEPESRRKRAAAIAALAFIAVCPFSTIYTATILTETPTIFLSAAMCLTATLAFKAVTWKRSVILWTATGIIAGMAVLFRPDSGLFAAAIGLTLVGDALLRPQVEPVTDKGAGVRSRLVKALKLGAIFSAAFCLVLTPWTIRNKRLFHVFQPLAPAHAEMPGEFVPRGYLAWLRTWIEDQRYIGPVLWKLEEGPIDIDDFPDTAFDSNQERQAVAALLEKYNNPPDQESQPETLPSPTPTPSPEEKATNKSRDSHQANQADEESEQSDEEDEGADAEQDQAEEPQGVEMTPEIDAAFARIARERISRSPLRYYLQLPFRRAISLWFDTHSQYYPFEGELTPFEDLDYEIHQQFWLPLFAGLTWIYTLLGAAGAWLLWRSRDFVTRRWVVLVGLMIFLRLGFFATLENPEPRYVVEVFPFLSVLAGIAVVQLAGFIRERYRMRPRVQ